MKKIFIAFVLSLITLYSKGQISMECDTTYFKSDKILNDIKYYNHFLNKYGNNVILWAGAMKMVFPTDESNRLDFIYILKTDAPVDKDRTKRICMEWCGEMFPYCQDFLIIDKSDDCIKGKGVYERIGKLPISAVKRITNHAFIEVTIRIKDNRIKFEVIGRQYHYLVESPGRNKTIIYRPGRVFPFVEEYEIYNYSETAESYVNSQNVLAESYVMFCYRTISLARSFLDYLNKNIHSSVIQEDDDW